MIEFWIFQVVAEWFVNAFFVSGGLEVLHGTVENGAKEPDRTSSISVKGMLYGCFMMNGL